MRGKERTTAAISWERLLQRSLFPRAAARLAAFGKRLGCELLRQALHRLGLAAHAQERTGVVGALLEHLAAGEDLAALVLRRPGEEDLRLHQALLEKGLDRLAQLVD